MPAAGLYIHTTPALTTGPVSISIPIAKNVGWQSYHDKTIKELDWTMCPNGKCPIAGTYDWGTKAYHQLDPVISTAKENNLKLQNRIKKFKR